ncbi:STAS domain-containing protein [Micromonospora sp. KLBMP9576]|uniref:STAS domain-containing protein n=1 Tax=Micromonospora sp. KLBMP9576 TaxID=3424769 RepID=UPI003D8D3115
MSVTVDRSDAGAPLVRVGGDFAYPTAAPVRAEVDRLLADAPPALVLDFSDLLFIDSTGLGVIVHAWREGQRCGTTLRLRATPRFLETILDMTGVTGLLNRPLGEGRTAADGREPATGLA